MRVLLINNIFPPDILGGYELMAFDVADEFSRRGHEVLVATSPLRTKPTGEVPIDFEVVRSLSSWPPPLGPRDRSTACGACIDLTNIAALNVLLLRFAPDVVYCMNLAGLGAAGVIWFLEKSGYSPVVHLADNIMAYSAGDEAELFGDFRAFFGLEPFAERVTWVAMSRRVLGEVEASLGMSLDGAILAPGWARYDDPAGAAEPSRDPDVARFVFASRVAPHKGIHIMLEAAARLRRRVSARFVVDVYGDGEIVEWSSRAKAMRLDQQVSFKGALAKPEMIAAFAGYHALVFPTWEREPFGLVAVEAAAQGCIPIMTAGIGAGEWMVDGEDCVMIRREAGALSFAMQSVIEMDSVRRAAFSARISRRAREMFSFSNVFPRLAEIAEANRRAGALDPDQQRRIFSAAAALVGLWRG